MGSFMKLRSSEHVRNVVTIEMGELKGASKAVSYEVRRL